MSAKDAIAGWYKCQTCKWSSMRPKIPCPICGSHMQPTWAERDEPQRTPGVKASNPKDAIASNKAPLHLVPASFKAFTALALAEGMMKYGAWNWRAAGVRASVYVSALQRHIDKWFNGEEFDPKTGVPHLANAAACLAVLIDSKVSMNMTDDRPPRQYSLPGLVDEEIPAAIARLRDEFGDANPKHWDINSELER